MTEFYDTFHKQWMRVKFVGESVISLLDEKGERHTMGIEKFKERKMAMQINAPEMLRALMEARDMLIDQGMRPDSVGLIGIENVIKKVIE